MRRELSRSTHAIVQHGVVAIHAFDQYSLFRPRVPLIFDPEDGEPRLLAETRQQRAWRQPLDMWRIGAPEGDGDLPCVAALRACNESPVE
jgi:hypothetical protein